MKDNVLKKGLVYAIVVLFIGASIIPLTGSKLVDKTSVSDDTACMENFNEPTIVSISPSSQIVKPGEYFTVSVYVEPGEWILGVFIQCLYFNASLIYANYIEWGDLFPSPPPYLWPEIDNDAGTISEAYGLGTLHAGPGYFFHIHFIAQQLNGKSFLDIEGVNIKNMTGVSVPSVVNNGTVNIPMDEDINMDHIVYFTDLVAIVMRYNDEGPPGWIREDVDNNGQVYFDDLIAVAMHYGEEW